MPVSILFVTEHKHPSFPPTINVNLSLLPQEIIMGQIVQVRFS